jgi:hypothetical protein
MKRTDLEEGILELIAETPLAQELRTLEIFDHSKLDNEGQLIVVTPAVLLVPGAGEFKKADIYGYTYDQDVYYSLLVAATNYRSPASRRESNLGEIGVNEMLDQLQDSLRGKNPIAGISTGARIFLVSVEAQPDLGPCTVYSLTFRVGDFLQPAV